MTTRAPLVFSVFVTIETEKALTQDEALALWGVGELSRPPGLRLYRVEKLVELPDRWVDMAALNDAVSALVACVWAALPGVDYTEVALGVSRVEAKEEGS